MTTTDQSKEQTWVWIEKIEWTTHQNELVEELNKTPLTIEEKITNVNAWVWELLNLFKNVLKKQEDIENILEKQISENAQNILNKDKKIEYIIQQINTLIPNKDKIFHDIFSGKDWGEIQKIESGCVQKGGIREYIHRNRVKDKYANRPNNATYIEYENEVDGKNFILYCINIVLALKSRKIHIESEWWEWDEIFYKTQWFSWTIEEVKEAIKNYCYIDQNDPADVLKYIIYLYNKYNKE